MVKRKEIAMLGKVKKKEFEDESQLNAEVKQSVSEGTDNQENCNAGSNGKSKETLLKEKINTLKKELEEVAKQKDEYIDTLQRVRAEFDNYRKRVAKEKNDVYIDSVKEIAQQLLPVIDNFERAIGASKDDEQEKEGNFKNGIQLVYRQFKDILRKIGIEEIECIDCPFDPELHNAVMHISDESYGENQVIEELLKGYIYKGTVIRHSMVKVAN